ncbi:hypothetical protein D3C85_1079910 [compost metagenome]
MVGRPHLVTLSMGKLTLNDIRIKAFLVEGGGCQSPKAVWGGNPLVAHPSHGITQRVLTHGVGQLTLTREQQLTMP